MNDDINAQGLFYSFLNDKEELIKKCVIDKLSNIDIEKLIEDLSRTKFHQLSVKVIDDKINDHIEILINKKLDSLYTDDLIEEKLSKEFYLKKIKEINIIISKNIKRYKKIMNILYNTYNFKREDF